LKVLIRRKALNADNLPGNNLLDRWKRSDPFKKEIGRKDQPPEGY
jgi:hypothetical protein